MPHRWRKSSYSGGNGGACIELAYVGAVRDSKNPTGPVLVFSQTELTEFLATAKSGRFAR
jgi:hypothetical protein